MTNMDLWDRVSKTDPSAVKPITGKQYKGNSPKPYWLIEQATKTFGPVGIGWGCNVKSERFERLSETDVLHVAVVSVWYVLDGKRSETFEQMGGTKAAYMTNGGNMLVDEDAGKKSVTDGMVKCLSMIGFAGDIFSGRWDDSKYVEGLKREFADKPSQAEPDAIPTFNAQQSKLIRTVAQACIQAFNEGKEWEAYEEYTSLLNKAADEDRRNDLKLALSSIFQPHSGLRTCLKKYAEEERAKEQT